MNTGGLNKYKYLGACGSCHIGEYEYFIDRRNILYNRNKDGVIQYVTSLNFAEDELQVERRYGITPPLCFGRIVICVPSCGRCITLYDSDKGEVINLPLNTRQLLCCVEPAIIDGIMYVISTTQPKRRLYRIDIQGRTIEEVEDFSDCITQFDIKENYFFSVSSIQVKDKMYIGVRDENQIVEYVPQNNKAQLCCELPDGYRIEYIFLDEDGYFWVTRKEDTIITVIDKTGRIQKTINVNFDNGFEYVYRICFLNDYAYIFPLKGSAYAIYNSKSEEIVYKNIADVCNYEEIEENQRFFWATSSSNKRIEVYLSIGRALITTEGIFFEALDKSRTEVGSVIYMNEIKKEKIGNVLYHEKDMSLSSFLECVSLGL